MSDIAIRVEGLGKRYRLGEARRYKALRDTLVEIAGSPLRTVRTLRKARASTNDDDRVFWALKDVSFEIKQGEVVGIVGRNGAGKSTLLKLLSRVAEPTEGYGEIRGRVGSLLEVGTGFHPELTGRENVYLNGAVLGMGRTEIKRKFDEIVAFAEVERFMDTPVKFYSSGMYLRLAFAVAAHLEPEILMVDEVLAVGDAAFQKKCLDKMRDVTRTGRTIMLVSHNMGAIKALCRHTMFLERGRLRRFSRTEEVLREYLTQESSETGCWKRSLPASASACMYFENVEIVNEYGQVAGNIGCTDPFQVVLTVISTTDVTQGVVAVRFTSQDGTPVFTTTNNDVDKTYHTIRKGRHRFSVGIPADFLSPGSYSLVLGAVVPGVIAYDVLDGQLSVTVEDTGSHASVLRDGRLGIVTPVLEWTDCIV